MNEEPLSSNGASATSASAGAEPQDDRAPQLTAVPEPPAQPPDDRDTSDSEPDEAIEPDSLWMDPQVGEELYGDQFAGSSYADINAHGPAAFGNNNTVYVSYEGQPPAKPIIRHLPAVPDLLKVYAYSAADEHLDAVLSHRSTACLTGVSNTGRFSTACAALARHHSADRVREVLLPADVEPDVIVRGPDCIAEDHGYVLRLAGDRHVTVMRRLADTFRQRSASLLLIRDDDVRAKARHSAEVRHQRPLPREVFRHHLRHLLCERWHLTSAQGEQQIDWCLQIKELGEALDATYGPREAVAIASAIANRHPVDESAMEEILALSQPRRREQAADILQSRRAEADRRHRRTDQHERAFRMSYAVFHRLPLHCVFEAADLLLEQIDGEANRPEWGRMALQHPVFELLGPLREDWQEGQEKAQSRGGASRMAWLRDPKMRGAIIDVAWHDFDSTRPALLKWLNTMAASDDDPVRRATAQVAGLLAHHDFDRVCSDLIDGWAASPRPRLRQAAAWAIVTADFGGHVTHRVRKKVRQWANGRLNHHRDVAALVYASGLQQPDLSWSLADLRRIAEDRMQQNVGSVAEAVSQLYATDRTHQIISELADWAQAPPLQRHAANALLALAGKSTDESTGTPVLLERLAASEIDGIALARIWRMALLIRQTSPAGWAVLGDWMADADLDDNLRKTVGELVSELAGDATVRRRMRFHLARHPKFRNGGLPSWIEPAMRDR